MKLVLICPAYHESFWTFTLIQRDLLTDIRGSVSPLGLASVAALTPAHWQVTIIDENVEEIPWDIEADLVGICAMTAQFHRQLEIAQRFREIGRRVVVGGSHASLIPEDYEGKVDCVISGEAELIWPQFCRDFENGEFKPLYKESGSLELANCPTPRFDLLKLKHYHYAGIQFSRGCPFRCEFCDIIVAFGRKPRTKTPEQVGKELDELRRLGVRNVFFVDDNLIGHKPKCKELLAYLAAYQREHCYQFVFGTEASINLAGDPELLSLFREANFGWLFIGIESPDEAALKETLKFQNTGFSLLQSVHAIQATGIEIKAGFIVGFDVDDLSTFDRQYEFIQASGISIPMLGLLVAIEKTPLWDRLEKAGRLLPVPALRDGGDNTRPYTNVVPLKMEYDEMISAYVALWRRLYTPEAMFERIRNKFRALGPPNSNYYLKPGAEIGVFFRFLKGPLWRSGPRVWYFFVKSLQLSKWSLPLLIILVDSWIRSLALKEFADRIFSEENLPWFSMVRSRLGSSGAEAPGVLDAVIQPPHTQGP